MDPGVFLCVFTRVITMGPGITNVCARRKRGSHCCRAGPQGNPSEIRGRLPTLFGVDLPGFEANLPHTGRTRLFPFETLPNPLLRSRAIPGLTAAQVACSSNSRLHEPSASWVTLGASRVPPRVAPWTQRRSHIDLHRHTTRHASSLKQAMESFAHRSLFK